MSAIVKISRTKKPITEDTLRVNRDTGAVTIKGRLAKFRDKDTRQMILYIPSLDISGYGATLRKAQEMLRFSVSEYFQYLIKLSKKHLEAELVGLGWKQILYGHKEYSKAFVNSDGELKSFNAVADEVELLTVEA